MTGFYKNNVAFISVSDDIDLSTATGLEALKLLSAFYRFELDKISERTKLGLLRAKAEGKMVGRPKGAKDRGTRRIEGYLLREQRKRVKQTNKNSTENQPLK